MAYNSNLSFHFFLQAYKQRQVLDVGGPVMRKKRSFKRHSSQNVGGTQRYFFEGMYFKKDSSFTRSGNFNL